VTSTTVDAALAVLLLSAAVVVVAQPANPAVAVAADRAAGSPADVSLETLATTTASLNYSLSPGARRADSDLVEFSRTDGPEFDRHSHGTLLELLVRATRATVTVDGDPLTHTGEGLRDAVRAPVASALGPTAKASVRWEPYPDAHLGAGLAVGPEPPRTGSVRTARTTVPLGGAVTVSDADRRAAVADGYPGVARLLADRTVAALFPERAAALALRGDYPLAPLVAYRYRRAAAAHGTNVSEPLAERDAAAANRKLTAAMASRVAPALRDRYPSPSAAARALTVDRVTVVVRTWSR
jgi:hypothetical protein